VSTPKRHTVSVPVEMPQFSDVIQDMKITASVEAHSKEYAEMVLAIYVGGVLYLKGKR
jgi:hypothetical protein